MAMRFSLCTEWRMIVKRLLLIVNPRAGKSKSLGPLYDAIARLSAGGYLVYVGRPRAPGDATRFARDLGPDLTPCLLRRRRHPE